MSSEQAAAPPVPSNGGLAGPKARAAAAGFIVALAGIATLSELSLLAVFALLAGALLFPAARPLALAYTMLIMGCSVAFSDVSLNLGAFKLYGADILILLLAFASISFAAALLRGERNVPRAESLLTWLFIASCCYGLLLVISGIAVQNHSYDKVFGDFRRMYFYGLAFLIPLWIPLRRWHLGKLKYAILGAGAILIAVGAWRILTQTPIRLDENLATGYTGHRMLAVTEFSVCALVLAYVTAVIRLGTRFWYKAVAVAFAGALAALMALSGFRLALVFIVFAPALLLCLVTWARRDSLWTVARTGAFVALAAIPCAVVMGVVFRDQFDKMLLDMRVRSMDDAITGDYRQWTWRQSFAEFRQSPIVGAGLGHNLVFLNRTRAGFFEHRKASAHSTLVSVLYQTGVIGFGFFAAFHGGFILYFLAKLRKIPPEYHAVACGLFTGYVCLMLASFSQPLRVAGYIAIALTMGWLCRIAREQPAVPHA